MKSINDFELGTAVKEHITGFQGVVYCKTIHLNGCHRVGIQPTTLKEGEPQKGIMVDVQQVDLIPDVPVIKSGSIGLDWGNVKLGVRVRDLLSNYEGIVVAKTDWFGGKKRVGVMSQKLHDGCTIPIQEFDVTTLEVLDSKAIFGDDVENSAANKPGGPFPDPKP